MIEFRGILEDGRPIAMGIPDGDYENFVKEVVGHFERQFCPPGLDFFVVTLQDGRKARLFVKAENKERFLNAIAEHTANAVHGAPSGDTQTVMLPCKGCGGTLAPGGQKTVGFASLVKAVTSGPASDIAVAVRDAICNACQDKDSKGERLFRIIDGEAYCGLPRDLLSPSTLYRDEALDGCGCALRGKNGKHAFKDSACPKKYWGPEGQIEGEIA